MKSVRLLILALLAVSLVPAAPMAYNFSYQSSKGLLAGMLTGELQGDNNTVVVSSFSMVTFNGNPGPDLPFLYSLVEAFLGPGPLPPVVSLDGLGIDFLACSGPLGLCVESFYFAPAGSLAPVGIASSSFAYGFFNEEYLPENWSLTPKVPEPSSFALLGLGVLAVVVRRRR
ncbi:MAG: PEP-CTERM sorting domain-containing protein [Acidobacteria bacterium]|nr:PEP-CTERM sorting domain-containing protein [Acidobacteriota bacterium]